MRRVDSSLEPYGLLSPLSLSYFFVLVSFRLFIPPDHFKFVFGFAFTFHLLFFVIVIVNVLYEQISVQLHLRSELLLADIPPLVIEVIECDLFLQFAIWEYLHHIRTSEQIPFDDSIHNDKVRVFIPGLIVLSHVDTAVDVVFLLPNLPVWFLCDVEMFIKLDLLSSVLLPHQIYTIRYIGVISKSVYMLEFLVFGFNHSSEELINLIKCKCGSILDDFELIFNNHLLIEFQLL